MIAKLKPCPFCGGDHVRQLVDGTRPQMPDRHVESFWVECSNCDTEGPVCDTEVEAVERWNERHETI